MRWFEGGCGSLFLAGILGCVDARIGLVDALVGLFQLLVQFGLTLCHLLCRGQLRFFPVGLVLRPDCGKLRLVHLMLGGCALFHILESLCKETLLLFCHFRSFLSWFCSSLTALAFYKTSICVLFDFCFCNVASTPFRAIRRGSGDGPFRKWC